MPKSLIFLVGRGIGLIFLTAGAAKMIDSRDINALLLWQGMPQNWWLVSVLVLALIELTVGYALLVYPESQSARWATIGCLVVFLWFLIYMAHVSNPPKCGCGGLLALFQQNENHIRLGILRNILFIGVLVVCDALSRKQTGKHVKSQLAPEKCTLLPARHLL